MVYNAIGIMSGSSLDGLDIVYTLLFEQRNIWKYEIQYAECVSYNDILQNRLKHSTEISAKEYCLLDKEFGNFIGDEVIKFIENKNLQHKVNFLSVHGHTTFHLPKYGVSEQLGKGATIAAITQLPVITDLRSMDVAFGGEGAPIVPMGEKLLFNNYKYFLNIGGIANVSVHQQENIIAFDVCSANKVLNMLAQEIGSSFDNNGNISSRGRIDENLLKKLNELEYYHLSFPKSLANEFGIETVYPLVKSFNLKTEDALHTYIEHICYQIANSLKPFTSVNVQQLLITGGGAFNSFLIKVLEEKLRAINFEIVVPDKETVKFKEALIVALLGALRWREQYTVLSSVTGAKRNSIGGALWLGTEA